MERKILFIVLIGLIVRFAIAPIAGHPYDLGLWAYSARLYYESRTFDVYFPALPLLYYIQLAFYSIYAALRYSGLHDYQFLYHTNYMIEGVFLKLPMILSDLGIFLVLLRFTKKLQYATFYYLNPFIIYLSSAWGMYDSLMMLPLTAGFMFLARNQRKLSTISFVISGLIKLFGFIPFLFLVLENLMRKRFKELIFQLLTITSITVAAFIPFVPQSGLQDFFSGFVLRFFGLSGAQTSNYNIFTIILGTSFGGASPYIWLGVGIAVASFLVQMRKKTPVLTSTLFASIVAAVLLIIFSQSEPQWISWVIPLSLLYSFVTGREGLAYYSYLLGIFTTFLTMTTFQGSGYVLTGIPFGFFGTLDFTGRLMYSIMSLSMLLILLGFLLRSPRLLRQGILDDYIDSRL